MSHVRIADPLQPAQEDERLDDLTAVDEFDALDGPGISADLVRVYLNEIGRVPLLTAAEEVELSERIEAGLYATELLRRDTDGEEPLDAELRSELQLLAAMGRRARTTMLQANLRLVVSVAKKYSHLGLPLLDLVQEGNLGLVRAVEKFDYRKGFKFSTYATWWIRQSISRGMAEQLRTVRLPVHVHEQVSRLARVARQLSQQLEREATPEELAEALELDVERVIELRRVSRDVLSLDTPVGDDQETVVGDLVVDDGAFDPTAALELQFRNRDLRRAVETLPEREATIVLLRYGLVDGKQHTLDDIGRRLGLTRERIRQLEKQALITLREPGRTRHLLDWAS